MKKNTMLLIATLLMVSAAELLATPTGRGTPDVGSTSLLAGVAAAGLFGLRRFLKK